MGIFDIFKRKKKPQPRSATGVTVAPVRMSATKPDDIDDIMSPLSPLNIAMYSTMMNDTPTRAESPAPDYHKPSHHGWDHGSYTYPDTHHSHSSSSYDSSSSSSSDSSSSYDSGSSSSDSGSSSGGSD